MRIAERTCLWYGSFHTQTVRIVLLRDDATDTSYDLALVTTDLHTPAAELIRRYAWRWSIEVTFGEARDLLGVGQARNRTENAVRRTVPFGLYCYSVTVIWYTLHGHHPNDAAEHRAARPWYTTKTDPAFSDMLAKLRRVIIAARSIPAAAGQPSDVEIRAVPASVGPSRTRPRRPIRSPLPERRNSRYSGGLGKPRRRWSPRRR